MNYARISDQLFVTAKDLTVRKPLAKDVKARREYIRNHQFSISVNPSTQETELQVIKE